MTLCVRCGCTDYNACTKDGAPCHWSHMSIKTMAHGGKRYGPGELGICSACDDGEDPTGFERVDGDFDPADPDLIADADDSGLILPGDPDFHL